MYLVAIAWIYVVLMMAVAEALSSNGSVLGAVITFLLYGALPLSIVLYVMGAPSRRQARRAAEAARMASAATTSAAMTPGETGADAISAAGRPAEADAGSHATGQTVTPVGKES